MHLISESTYLELGFKEPTTGYLTMELNDTDPAIDLNNDQDQKRIGKFWAYANYDESVTLNIAQFGNDKVNMPIGIWVDGNYHSDNIHSLEGIIEALSKVGYQPAINYKRKEFIDTVISELNVFPL